MTMPSAQILGPRHFNGLDAKTIKTEQFLMADHAVKTCAKHSALALISGPAGRGKTFAVESATSSLEVPVVRTLLGSSTNRKQMARTLLAATTGSKPAKRVTHEDLVDECLRLYRRPHVAVIDEAQHLNFDCNFFIRFLIDHPDAKIAFILVGAEGCKEQVGRDQMLATRVYRTVEFDNVPVDQILMAMPAYHAVYAGTDIELLEELSSRYPVDQHRALAKFTMTLVDLCEEEDKTTMDERMMEQALYLLAT